MNSIFLRLYLLIVITILSVGFGLDFFWQKFEPASNKQPHLEQVALASAQLLEQLPQEQLELQILELNRITSLEFKLYETNEPYVKDLLQVLTPGQPLITENQSMLSGFLHLPNQNKILEFTHQSNQTPSYLRAIFITLFYSIIAVVVFFWIWPLSKDLSRLETAVSQFSEQQWKSRVELPATSSVAHLAKAYNTLLDRIKSLIDTQQSMSHSISHELRTPLARIRFALQMAEETENLDEIRSQLKSVMEDVEEMNQLISELLNFAALEKISVVAKLERGNINLLIEDLLARLSRNHPELTLKFIPNSQVDKVLCDSYLIERALQNLVLNACKFAQQQILIEVAETDGWYEISVADDGDGIPDQKKAQVFESFVQLPSDSKGHGFGLGLAIVKRVMDLHQGSAILEDSELGGAKFSLRWPKHPN